MFFQYFLIFSEEHRSESRVFTIVEYIGLMLLILVL